MATSTTAPAGTTPTVPPRRGRELLRLSGTTIVALALVLTGTLIGLRAARSGVLPRVVVDGVRVGGDSRDQLVAELERLADRKAAAEIRAVRDDAAYAGVAGVMGYQLDVEATTERVLHRGRQGNPLAALGDQLRVFVSDIDVEPVESVDGDALDEWAQAAADALAEPPREGGLRFDGAAVTRVDPKPGADVDLERLVADARWTALNGDGGDIEVVDTVAQPTTTTSDVDRVERDAEQALSDPVRLHRNDGDVTLSPQELGDVLQTEVEDGDLRLVVGPELLRDVLGEARIAEFEREPRDADIVIRDGEPEVVKGRRGFVYHEELAADQLTAMLLSDGERSAELDGEIAVPEFTTAEARDLQVVEEVSSFTTHHACCESRVTNIHRIADIVDGHLVLPGETFSVNDFVGERTVEKGFAGGGAIFEGEFVEQIGGGVSQFATTLYNAAFFGGYAIPEHKAHSYYISRYPVGREATLNFPNVDLKVKNNSPHGLLIDTSYTGTSITVTFYGKEWVEVSTTTGERHNIKQPTTQTRTNPDMEPGERRVVQEAGGVGFDIIVTRRLEFPDGRVETEKIFTRYLPQPRIVERGV